jgi:hypothetical protein
MKRKIGHLIELDSDEELDGQSGREVLEKRLKLRD